MEVGIRKLDECAASDIKGVKLDIAKLSKEFSSTVIKVNAMNNTMEKFMNEKSPNQRKIGRVTKWVNIRNKGNEFAFKRIFRPENERIIQYQVTILKELHNFQNIIKFYGLITDGNKWILVTEWAEHGNLREFYTNHKEL